MIPGRRQATKARQPQQILDDIVTADKTRINEAIDKAISEAKGLSIEKAFDMYCRLFFNDSPEYSHTLYDYVQTALLGSLLKDTISSSPYNVRSKLYTQLLNRHDRAKSLGWEKEAEYALKQYKLMQEFLS